MHSQRLSHRITIERPNTTTDDFGHRVPGWVLVAQVWAAIRPMGSQERLAAHQMQSGQTHVITVRASTELAGMTGEWRATLGARAFNVIGLPRNINEAGRFIVFDATEGGTHGH